MNPPTEFPKTPGELYDLLQEQFGIGDYDERTSDVPWYKARLTEIAKLKGMLKRRNATPRQMTIAAWYARERHLPIAASWQLFDLIPEAMKAHRTATSVPAHDVIGSAIDEALKAGETAWAERLARVTGEDAAVVLQEWRNRHV